MLPEVLLSKDSIMRTDLHAIHTPLVPVKNTSRGRGRHGESIPQVVEGTVHIPRSLLPCFLSGSIFVDEPGNERLITLKHSRYFCVPLGVSRGAPMLLGATVVPKLAPKTVLAQDSDDLENSTSKRSNSRSSKGQPTDGVSINFSVISRHARTLRST